MEKYIDADKLKAEIERRKQTHKSNIENGFPDEANKISEDDHILSIITSLQQEQESVAEKFARMVRENLIGIDKEVQQKFEQLYFEITGNKMYGGYND